MSDVQIAVVDQQDTQIVLAVPGVQGATGSEIPTGGTVDQVLRKSSSTNYDTNWSQVTSAMIADGTIVNADINASAAIAGTKISPDFGSQTVQTTGIFSAAGGSAAAPSIAFTGDTNTGIYSPGADQVAISTSGVGRLLVDSSGNLIQYSETTLERQHRQQAASAYTATNIKSVIDGATGYLTFETGSNWTNGNAVERLRITSGGLVGVGTSSPNYQLHVTTDFAVGASGFNQQLTFSNDTIQSLLLGTGYTALKLNPLGGNVGVGTTSPNQLLDVRGNAQVGQTGENFFNIRSSSGNGQFLFFTESGVSDRWLMGSPAGSGDLVFRSGAYNFSTGSERLRVTSAGLVGIGVSAPVHKVQINTSSAAGAYGNAIAWAKYDDPTPYVGISFDDTNDGLALAANTGSSSLNATHLFIKRSTGRVGIGTTSPQNPFVVSNAGAEGLEIIPTAGSPNVIAFNRGTASYAPLTLNGSVHILQTSGTERARIDSSGRLLVGTSTSVTDYAAGAGKLQVTSDTFNNVVFSAHTSSGATDGSYLTLARSRGSLASPTNLSSGDLIGRLQFSAYNNVGTQYKDCALIEAYADAAQGDGDLPSRLVFSTTADGASSPTERLRITSGGSVFIGNTGSLFGSTGAEIANTGTAAFSADSNYPLLINRQTTDGTIVEIRRGWSTVGTISVTTTATAYNTSSDYRLKENVTPVTDGITRLQQLKPSRFNFIADPDTVVDGFIAHEVQDIVPEAITGTKDAVDDDGNPVYQGIDQSKLVPLLTAALQEAIGEIESLKARLTAAGI